MEKHHLRLARWRHVLRACGINCFRTNRVAEPVWWPTTDGDTAEHDNNYGAVNAGQLKNMVFYAASHFDTQGVDVPIEIKNMLTGWASSTSNNYSLINQGQIKNVASHFWQDLNTYGLKEIADFPWTASDESDDNHYAAVNIGQLKNCFNFYVPIDIDNDRLSNRWESENGLDIINSDSNDNGVSDDLDDLDGDSFSNYQEFINRDNPLYAHIFDANTSEGSKIIWTKLRNASLSIIDTSSHLTKEGGLLQNDSGGRSMRVIDGNGSVSAKLSGNHSSIGLSSHGFTHDFLDFEHAIFITGNLSRVLISESGVYSHPRDPTNTGNTHLRQAKGLNA